MATRIFDRTKLKEAMREDGLTRGELAEKADVSLSLLDKALKAEAVGEARATAIAEALNLPLDELARPTTEGFRDKELYPLVGLWAEPPAEQPDEVPFQNFEMHEGKIVNNPIAGLWASPLGSRISATVLREGNDRILRIEFDNHPSGYPGNVSVHPTGMCGRKRMAEQQYLTFEVRAWNNEASLEDEKDNPPIGLAVRVRDALLVQWEYRTKQGYLIEPIVDSAWKGYAVDLDYSGGALRWNKFIGGDNRSLMKPDFSVITTVVFEVGRGLAGLRPGAGKGCLDIRNLRLRSKM